MQNRPIGIFDSGVGGLTVLKQIEKVLPGENIVYFGDTARVPYGNKSKQTIVKFSRENILFLLKKKVKLVVVACNSSSALALRELRAAFSLPIIGVIEAGATQAVKKSLNKKVGVIGTKATISSKSYDKQIRKIDKSLMVYSKSCPLFVPLVEEAVLKGKIVNEAMKMYLDYFRKKGVDTIILGCTHYPLLKGQIARFLKSALIIDSAEEVAKHTKKILFTRGWLNNSKKASRKDFYLSDKTEEFSKLARLFLKRTIPKPKIANA
jgi:glutamate racemase